MRTFIVPRIGTKKREKMYARGVHMVAGQIGTAIMELTVAKDKAPSKARKLSKDLDAQIVHYGEKTMTVYHKGKVIHTEDCSAIEPEDVL